MNDLNAGFLLDIWHDLKAKRLAPVAIGLVVALIAIPALLMKGDDGGDAPLPVPIPGAANTGPQVVVADELADGGSKLDSYEARDPFGGIEKSGGGKEPIDGSAGAPIDSAGDKGSAGSGLTGITGDTTGSTDTGSTGGGLTGGTDTGTGDGTSTPPTTQAPVKKTSFYNFRLDIKFGKPGRETRTASMSRLSFLYGAGRPIALFLGVDESERNALFLVTPGLNHQGEGECLPKPTQCDFMSIAIGKEHYFSANDREFRMELLDIKRVKASADKKQRKIARKAAERSAARTGDGGGVSGDGPAEPYEWPLLVDSAG